MKPWGKLIAAGAVVALAITGYVTLRPDGDGDTDAWAQEIVERIGHPAGEKGMDYARNALDNKSHNLTVLRIEDPPIKSPDTNDRITTLVFRLHKDAETRDSWNFFPDDAVTACYRADFNYYGVMNDGPDRVSCPDDDPIIPPPLPRNLLPSGYHDAFHRFVQNSLPTTAEGVLAALKLPPSEPDHTPEIDVRVRDNGVGIAASLRSEQHGQHWLECVYAVRLNDGEYAAAWYQFHKPQPSNEKRCTPDDALDYVTRK